MMFSGQTVIYAKSWHVHKSCLTIVDSIRGGRLNIKCTSEQIDQLLACKSPELMLTGEATWNDNKEIVNSTYVFANILEKEINSQRQQM